MSHDRLNTAGRRWTIGSARSTRGFRDRRDGRSRSSKSSKRSRSARHAKASRPTPIGRGRGSPASRCDSQSAGVAACPPGSADIAHTGRSRSRPVWTLSVNDETRGIPRVSLAGVPGLEPRTTEPESAVLPITPYPKGSRRNGRQGSSLDDAKGPAKPDPAAARLSSRRGDRRVPRSGGPTHPCPRVPWTRTAAARRDGR